MISPAGIAPASNSLTATGSAGCWSASGCPFIARRPPKAAFNAFQHRRFLFFTGPARRAGRPALIAGRIQVQCRVTFTGFFFLFFEIHGMKNTLRLAMAGLLLAAT
ncbi:Uncharacterized protein YfaZ precursor [Cronobacter dublinensis 582]|nr:Uncharacterized protein YfaZ precursor [Cronobacter dublinensis 582]